MIKSNKSKGFMIVIPLLISTLFVSAASADEALTANITPPVYYESRTGERFVARYGSLSDGSLHFVKIKMPDGHEYTLPQVLSGSGARYTDERDIVWWEHHGAVRIDVRGPDGKWATKYRALKEVKGRK